jgi:hypothetical protein
VSEEPGQPAATSDDTPEAAAREAAARRRRRAEVFGEVLPDSTSDDRDPARGSGEGSSEEWLRRNIPPHHG